MNDISAWVFLVLGVCGGTVLSSVFWWIINHYIVPNLEFSEEVSRSKAGFLESGTRHQIAIKNCGKRDAFNVKFRVRLKVKDVLDSGGKIWDFMDVSVSDNEYFVLRKGSMFRITPFAHLTMGFSRPMFPTSIRKKSEEGILSLDDIFNHYDEIKIFIEVIATDSFSGCAKYFRSKEYTKRDFRNGVFIGNDH